MLSLASLAVGFGPFAEQSFRQWDSGHYVTIARMGYVVGSCEGVPLRTPEDVCGNASWLPVYPLLIRGLDAIGFDPFVAGTLISLAAWTAALTLLWRHVLGDRLTPSNLAVMGLAAVFPGLVWQRAVFPMSLLTFEALLACLLLARRRWLSAGLAAAAGTLTHSLGFAFPLAAAVYVVLFATDWRRAGGIVDVARRLRTLMPALAAVSVPGALALVAYFGYLEVATGSWNAYFQIQASYDQSLHNPIRALIERTMTGFQQQPESGFGPRHQVWWADTLYQTLMVGGLVLAYVRRRVLSRLDVVVVCFVAVVWLVSLAPGAGGTFWRFATVGFPIVIVYRHLPSRLTWALIPAASMAAAVVAGLFTLGRLN